jgi:hypothetical protein
MPLPMAVCRDRRAAANQTLWTAALGLDDSLKLMGRLAEIDRRIAPIERLNRVSR